MNAQEGKTWIKIIVIIIAAAVGAVMLVPYLKFIFSYESTDDAFIDGDIAAISCRVSGYVEKVNVTDNQWVNNGDLLVELDSRDFQTKLDVDTASLAYASAVAEQSRSEVVAAEAEAKRAEKDYKRYEQLFAANGGVTQQRLDNAIAASQLAAAQLESAKKRVLASDAQIAQSKAAVEQARLNLSYTKIYSPQTGRLAKKSVEKGEYITVGQPLISIVPIQMWVTANFKETQLKNIKTGQPVQIKVDAFPQRVFNGHIDSFQAGTGAVFSLLPPENATGNYIKVVQRVPVKIVFDEDPDTIKMLSPGMSVVPKVKIK